MDKRICVLTGGCGGMGHAISLRLGKDHTMLLADISETRLASISTSSMSFPNFGSASISARRARYARAADMTA